MIENNELLKRGEFMRKILTLIFVSVLGSLLFISCNHQAVVIDSSEIKRDDSFVTKKYYEKNAKESFSLFLINPDENSERAINARITRLAEDGNQEGYTEDEIFAEMWITLSDAEKRMIIENSDELEVTVESSIGVEENSSIGRAALNGVTDELDSLAEYYGILETLKDIGNGKIVPKSILCDAYDDIEINELSADLVLEMILRKEDWNELRKVLSYIDEEEKFNEIKEKWKKHVEACNTVISTERASSSSEFSTPLIENVGQKLSDGDVLLTISKVLAYGIAGVWSHGGIFSSKDYELNGKKDSCFCVYTAEPENNDNRSNNERLDTDPDRWGYACLEPIYTYTKARRFAALHPKNYSATKARAAINDAKKIYYDTKAVYNLPWWELLGTGDTSHDLTKSNTYCTKVVYTAWKKNGVDLDSDIFAGNLVSPDDIFGSSVKRTASITVSVLGWKYEKTWVTYYPTTTVSLLKVRL